MEKPKEELMNMAEYEAFVGVVNAFTTEQKQVAMRLMPDELIWAEISGRYYEHKNKLDNILNAARA